MCIRDSTFTNPLLHSKGYGTLMLYLGCRFTLTSPSFECLIAYIRPTNTSSLKIHQRIGFTEVRESRHGSLPMAKEGHLCFELTSSSFNKGLVSQSMLDSINTSLISWISYLPASDDVTICCATLERLCVMVIRSSHVICKPQLLD